MNSAALPFDYLGFTAIAFAVFIALHIWLRRCGGKRGIPVIGWLTVLSIVSGGAFLVYRMGRQAGERVTHALLGFAPTYAAELERMGHVELSRDTSPSDPRYLEMITAEKRWLAANPVVNDIYTMREASPGKRYFVVDSETDYDHNGRYEGEREARTTIGESFDIDEPALTRASAGHGAINAVPTTDRCGTWVSAY